MNNKIFLVSPNDVKAASEINYNVDDTQVARAIRVAQNTYLREIIGDTLLSKLQELIEDGTIGESIYKQYAELCDIYCSEYLIAKANAEICIPISLKIRNVGVAQDSDTNINAAALEGIKELRRYYETEACEKANRLIDYLKENRDSFPELKGTECVCGVNNGADLRKRANINLYLGGK